MSCKVISVALQKGGAGKTTTVQNIGSILGNKGYKVLLIDADAQSNLSYACNADFNRSNLTIYEVLTGKANMTKAIQKKANYDIIPSSNTLDNIVTELDPSKAKDLILFRDALDPLKDKYDYIIIDTSPSLNILNVNVFIACDYVLIPTEPSSFALQGIVKLLDVIDGLKRANKSLKVLGIALTKYKHWTTGHQEIKEMLEQYLNNVHIKLFDTYISDSVIISNAQGSQEDLINYDNKSKVFLQYESLVDELLEVLRDEEQES